MRKRTFWGPPSLLPLLWDLGQMPSSSYDLNSSVPLPSVCRVTLGQFYTRMDERAPGFHFSVALDTEAASICVGLISLSPGVTRTADRVTGQTGSGR